MLFCLQVLQTKLSFQNKFNDVYWSNKAIFVKKELFWNALKYTQALFNAYYVIRFSEWWYFRKPPVWKSGEVLKWKNRWIFYKSSFIESWFPFKKCNQSNKIYLENIFTLGIKLAQQRSDGLNAITTFGFKGRVKLIWNNYMKRYEIFLILKKIVDIHW